MSIECRFTKECIEFMTKSCAMCGNNRKRNAPKSRYIAANDASLEKFEKHNDAYLAIMQEISPGAVVFYCPACEYQVWVGQTEHVHNKSIECEHCGLRVKIGRW